MGSKPIYFQVFLSKEFVSFVNQEQVSKEDFVNKNMAKHENN